MSRRWRTTGALALALAFGAVLAPSGAAGQVVPDEALELVHGRQVKIERNGASLRGELLAVSPDSLWVLDSGLRLVTVPLGSGSVQIRRHGWGAGRVVLWNAIGAVVTSAALASACSQVDDTDCGSVFPAVVLSWGVVGGIFGFITAISAHHDLPAAEVELRPYVRFPQGLPEGFVPLP